MKIYITGIIGMLGYGIYQYLKDREEVDGFDIISVDIPGMSYHKISLFDMDAIERELVIGKADIVIHTAALVNVDECEENPDAAKKLNTEVTRQLAEVCEKHKIKMVYISTDAVFDGNLLKLYTEEDETKPVNVYGKTKLEGEKFVLQNPSNLVLRTNIYGRNIQKKQSFGEWIYQCLCEGKELNMFIDIDFSPILVDELAELIYKLCQRNLSGLYHACGTGCITKYDFAVKLKEVFGIPSGIIHKSTSDKVNLKAKRSKHMGMSNKKLCTELQVDISTPEESIEKFYGLMKERDIIGN